MLIVCSPVPCFGHCTCPCVTNTRTALVFTIVCIARSVGQLVCTELPCVCICSFGVSALCRTTGLESCVDMLSHAGRIFTEGAWIPHTLVTIDAKTACATCCETGNIAVMSKEVCPGWIDWAPANAWAIIYRATAHDINATSIKGIQRASGALENRANNLKPAHAIDPNDPTDTE